MQLAMAAGLWRGLRVSLRVGWIRKALTQELSKILVDRLAKQLEVINLVIS